MTHPSSNDNDSGGLTEGGSGDGGTLGTPTADTKEEPPGSDGDTTVVSGGGVADAGGEDSAMVD
jgi:hypothetical protein